MYTYMASDRALGIFSLFDDEHPAPVAGNGSSASMGRWQRRVGVPDLVSSANQ